MSAGLRSVQARARAGLHVLEERAQLGARGRARRERGLPVPDQHLGAMVQGLLRVLRVRRVQ